MANVFANGLEISGKASDGKTIAAFPDVCFTPPENPATPPGVPIPYPSFGFSSDTENGTSTVKIGNKTVNIKNKSDLTKTSGTEAGSAAKKGVITSKNTGKEYYRSWSNNVKFDGEPVIRFTDMATNNHASDIGNTPPWIHVLKPAPPGPDCAKILSDCGLQLHAHGDSPCVSPDQSEHMMQNALFQNKRGDTSGSIAEFPKYSAKGAPCICMRGPGHIGADAPHGAKTSAQYEFAKNCGTTRPTVDSAIKNEMKSIKDHHPKMNGSTKPEDQPIADQETRKLALECLEAVIRAYLEYCSGKKGDDLNKTECRIPWGDKVPGASQSATSSI
jgi:hypothetical protein